MKKTKQLAKVGLTGCALCAGVMTPAIGQDAGGVTTEASLQFRFETTQNPTLTAGNKDTRSLFRIDAGAALNSSTPVTQFELGASGQVNFAFGDTAANSDEVSFDGKRVYLSYAHQAPRARLSASASYLEDDITYLSAIELVELDDGTVVAPEDLNDLRGTGTRANLSYAVRANIDEDQVFGWGLSVSGTEISYSDTSAANLNDTSSMSVLANAHFDLTEVLRLDARAGFATRQEDGFAEATTKSFSLGITAVRSDELSVSATATVEDPETSATRYTLNGGVTYSPNSTNTFSAVIGATSSDDFDTEIVGRLQYRAQPTALSSFGFALNSSVTDTSENEVVKTTSAIADFGVELTPRTNLALSAVYSDQGNLTTNSNTSSFSTGLRLNHAFTRDWTGSVGVSTTARSETGQADASSQAIFLSIGRSWSGAF